MRNVFIINPAAGKGLKQPEIAAAIKKYYSSHTGEYKIVYTAGPGDAGRLAAEEAAIPGEVRIFACGGEGTSFEVLNGIAGHENVTLGVIPCGTANDFLKFFKAGNAPFLDIEAQLAGGAVRMDIIKAGEYYCLNGCSAGMDAMVADDMKLFKRWPLVSGRAAYDLAIVKNFFKKLGVEIEISLDGQSTGKVRCLFAAVANAPYYGGGYMGAPNAVPYDGELDFTRVDVISRLRVPKFLNIYKKGGQGSLNYCHMQRCRVMEFSAKTKIPVNLDGEIIYADKMRFEIVPDALKFWLPAEIFSNC